MGPVTVLVAAREERTRAVCRAALAEASDVRVVAEAGTAPQLLAGVRASRPRVVVLASPLASPDDRLLLDVLSGPSTASRRPRTPRVLVVAPGRSENEVATTLAHGARGHLEPTRVRAWLAPAVRAIARGEAWCPRALVRTLVGRLRDTERALDPSPKGTTPWSNGRRGRRRRR